VALYSSIIQSEPAGVSQKNTTLKLLVQPKTDIPSGAAIELLLPLTSDVSITSEAITTAPLCEFLGLATPKQVECSISSDGSTITWITNDNVPAFNAIQVTLSSGFNNPLSTEPTQTFQMKIYTDSSKTDSLDYQTTDLFLISEVEALTPDDSNL